jgi:hypothetical protein
MTRKKEQYLSDEKLDFLIEKAESMQKKIDNKQTLLQLDNDRRNANTGSGRLGLLVVLIMGLILFLLANLAD